MLFGQKKNSKLIQIYLKVKSYNLKRQFKNNNKSCFIGKNVQIIGTKKLELGKNITISSGTWININNRDENDSQITIGDNSFIGRNNFFTNGKKIIIGKYFFSSKDCKFIGAGHKKNPFKPYIMGEVEFNNNIIIGDNVFLGAGATICGNVTIGSGSIIGANSLVINDIPPLSIAVGTPAKVIKRFDIRNNEWRKINMLESKDSFSEEFVFNYSEDLEINYFAADNYWL